MVWIDSPITPTWDVIDIAHAARAAHEVGAIPCIDSSVAPPVTSRAVTSRASDLRVPIQIVAPWRDWRKSCQDLGYRLRGQHSPAAEIDFQMRT